MVVGAGSFSLLKYNFCFEGLESLKVEIGTGSVICMANDLLPVDEKMGMCRLG